MNYRGIMWISIAAALLIVAGLMYIAASGGRSGSSSENVGSGRSISPLSSSDWIKGSPLAKTILVEYSDFQCPACGSYYPVMKKIEKDFGSSVQIVYRHFPLEAIHKNAFAASLASEAAGKQGKFWDMHDRLFEEQRTWSESADPKEEFKKYAREVNLSLEQFEKDMNSDEVKEKVRDMIHNGERAGIDSTPSFYMNGEKIVNPKGYEPFAEIIRKSQGK